MYWVWDIETYPNCFTFSVIREDGKFLKGFEVSEFVNEIDRVLACIDYLHDAEDVLVGFNNRGFDYPVLHDLLAVRHKLKDMTGKQIAKMIYEFAQKQIESGKKTGFPRVIVDDEEVVKQVDLYKVWHFDNKAKATSLKLLQFNMKSDSIEDLPYPVGMVLNKEQCSHVLSYNKHDVTETLKFFGLSKGQIEFRENLTQKYGRNFMNHNDTKIGKDYFIMELEKAGIPCYEYKDGKRKARQTKRPYIELKKCLFDYYDFELPEFRAVQDWFSRQRIAETKGVFTEIPEHRLHDVAQFAEMEVKRKKMKMMPGHDEPTDYQIDQFKREYPKGWIEEVQLKAKVKGVHKKSYWMCWKEASNLNVVVNGFRFDFGTGGIHGSLMNKVVRATSKYKIIDADVASMYPNIAISNDVYPEHLSEKFCEIYKAVYEMRKSYKKGTVENGMLKLALNGVYGDSNNAFSPFYDPAYTMKITINGQLSLCLLAEKLMRIPNLHIVQVNTDGITVAVLESDVDKYHEVCKQWQQQVKLELEFAEYSKMFIRDVNNYVAVYTNGKVKRKGAYQYEDLGWHQNHGGLIVQKAACAAMLEDKDVEEFIREHAKDPANKYDFLLRAKIPRSMQLVMDMPDGTVKPLQNVCRYYVSPGGGKLRKIMPPKEGAEEDREVSLESGRTVKVCNNILDYDGDLDYDYYVSEAKKLIIS
jgi:hypothetical protein